MAGESFDLIKYISDNSVVGATGTAALLLLYKIWRMLQTDRKGDNLDNAERAFRDEMRGDIKGLKESLKSCEDEKDKLHAQIEVLTNKIARIHTAVSLCTNREHGSCPITVIQGVLDVP